MDDYPDLRQLMASRTQHFVQFPDPFSVVRPHNNYYHQPNSSIAVGQEGNTRGLFEFGSAASASAPPSFSTIISNTTSVAAANLNGSTAGSSVGSLYGLELMNHHQHGWSINGNDGSAGNNSRWPRQETLTLLEIRSSLDSRFKETNQKGPLWDEVSRIMSEEHGYHRSGKKCKEKFENLYKYYKKTKEGKAGRQDGKHYRFFRQLEAIYGDQSTNPLCSTSDQTNLTGTLNPSLLYNHITTAAINQEYQQVKLGAESLSFSNNSTDDMETSTSENNGDHDLSNSANENQRCSRRVKKTWKTQVEEFVNSQMMKMMKAQEGWMEKMLKAIEGREEERYSKEDEWRKREAERFSQQVHEFWAKERTWVETRDASIMEALSQIRGMGTNNSYNCSKAKDEHLGLQLMDGGALFPSCSSHMNVDSASSLYIATNEAENLWNRYGGKLSK